MALLIMVFMKVLILLENDINISPFSSASLQELPEDTEEHPWVIPEEEYSRHWDLRFLHRACSIDPPGSREVDDVLSNCELPDNFLKVGVHIADVSYFVKQDSLLDLEAHSRGTTAGSTYHMLPPILSENLCSLREGKDRLAVSVIWTVDPDNDFEVLDVWSGRTIIRSRHQMSYAQARAILDGQPLCERWEIDGGPGHLAQLQSDLHNLAMFAQLETIFQNLLTYSAILSRITRCLGAIKYRVIF
jgi:DIS3-like exonuclease 1